jgi:hypothetical protein
MSETASPAWRSVDTKALVAEARDTVSKAVSANPEGQLDPRVLVPRLLLHVYRLPLETLRAGVDWDRELHSVLASSFWRRIRSRQQSQAPVCSLHSAVLKEIRSEIAQQMHEGAHYLGGFHEGIHLGLVCHSSADPFSLVTLSPLDVQTLIEKLPVGVGSSEVLVVSRLITAPEAPKNTLSFTLGRVFAWVRNHRGAIKLLLTYLDPNLGFSGSVYRATNWFLFATEPKRPYLYLDGEYITSRDLRCRFGFHHWETPESAVGDRLSRSSVPLRPLEAYGYWLRRS